MKGGGAVARVGLALAPCLARPDNLEPARRERRPYNRHLGRISGVPSRFRPQISGPLSFRLSGLAPSN